MIPTKNDAQQTAETGMTFWVAVLAVWLVLFAILVTLALALGIWNIVEAF